MKDLLRDVPGMVFLNLRKLNTKVKLYQDHFSYQGYEYAYDQFAATFVRLSDVDPNFAGSDHYFSTLNYLIYLLNYRLKNPMNRPLACNDNNAKLHQLTKLQTTKLRIPYSMVKVRSLICDENQQREQFIFKSMSAIRSVVKPLSYFKQQQIEASEPVLLQQLVSGTNIRVHVVGDQVCAIAVKSEQVDYRYDYDNRRFQEITLPSAIAAECVELAKQSDLLICGVDLILHGDDYYLLEVNPSPAFTFFESELGRKPITRLLSQFLNAKQCEVSCV